MRRHKRRRRYGHSSGAYWTVVIPYQEEYSGNQWMPKDRSGPFSTLTRGAFRSNAEAVQWANTHIPAGAKVKFRLVKA